MTVIAGRSRSAMTMSPKPIRVNSLLPLEIMKRADCAQGHQIV